MYVISDNFSKYRSRLLVFVIVLSTLAVISAVSVQTALTLTCISRSTVSLGGDRGSG